MCSTPAQHLVDAEIVAERDDALGDVLGEIADPLEIVGDAQRADDLAQIDRHRLAARDGQDRLFLDLALQRIDQGVGRDHLLGKLGVALDQRIDRLRDLLFGEPAHFGDVAREVLQVGVKRLHGMFGHQSHPRLSSDCLIRTGR